jgi:hypothetical protein
VKISRLVLPVLAALLLPACATRGSIRQLGHAEFEPVFHEKELTLVEPATQGEFDAYWKDATGDHRAATRMEIAPHIEGEELVFDMNASSRGPAKLDLLQVLAFPLGPKDVVPWKLDGRLPDAEHPAAAVFNQGHYVPGSESLHVDLRVPLAKIGGADQLAVPTLLGFEDGWVTVVYNIVVVPKPEK